LGVWLIFDVWVILGEWVILGKWVILCMGQDLNKKKGIPKIIGKYRFIYVVKIFKIKL
jgi:hypothetical protein